jgi:hypothetical protein
LGRAGGPPQNPLTLALYAALNKKENKIMEHLDLDVLLDQSKLQRQDRLRNVEIWRLAMAARQNRARYMSHLFRRLVAAAWQQLPVQTRLPKA